MIVIYSQDQLAIALWNSAERAFEREQLTHYHREYRRVPWEQAEEMDHQEMRDRAREIVEDCLKQAKALTKNPSPTSSATSASS